MRPLRETGGIAAHGTAAPAGWGVSPPARSGVVRLLACALACWLATLAGGAPPADAPNEDRPYPAVVGKLGERFLKEVIFSLYIHRHWVYAATAGAIYRASPKEKKWERLASPRWLPHMVRFAKQPRSASLVYCYFPAPSTGECDAFPTARKKLGVYRFDLQGKNWELVSSQYAFADVYVRDDKVLFALVDAPVALSGAKEPVLIRHIATSTDSGADWRDLSADWKAWNPFPTEIFPDPDHKDLVCLKCYHHQGNFVLQASDQGYKWKVVGIEDWQAKHPSDDDFFPKEYWGSAGIMYRATLSNYFGYPFGNRAEVPSIQISVGGPKHLKRHEAAVVTVETTFLCEGAEVTLVDSERGHLAWGLHRILPDGSREIVEVAIDGAKQWTQPDGTRYIVPPEKAVRPGPAELRLHKLGHRQSYKRQLDLSSMCDFSKPGTYRVQLFYRDGWIADPKKGEWAGGVTSPVFEVTISP